MERDKFKRSIEEKEETLLLKIIQKIWSFCVFLILIPFLYTCAGVIEMSGQ